MFHILDIKNVWSKVFVIACVYFYLPLHSSQQDFSPHLFYYIFQSHITITVKIISFIRTQYMLQYNRNILKWRICPRATNSMSIMVKTKLKHKDKRWILHAVIFLFYVCPHNPIRSL